MTQHEDIGLICSVCKNNYNLNQLKDCKYCGNLICNECAIPTTGDICCPFCYDDIASIE